MNKPSSHRLAQHGGLARQIRWQAPASPLDGCADVLAQHISGMKKAHS
ncbi:hypothetical protein [Aeromonas sp. BIGb0445]|nr:hypothetical protein [Aeromonas sp. BIGb0445]MCS3461767.1 hypothetical protein [Aeromonas sp. BIGb0445]